MSDIEDSVFHEGEVLLHRKNQNEDRLKQLGGRMIRDHMPDQHRDFFMQLSWIHLGFVDKAGHPHSILRTGNPGFVQAPGPNLLTIESYPLAGEPDDLQIEAGAKISVVGIEFSTRRRNRMNGTISAVDGTKVSIAVDQSYGNCPKYIQMREFPTDGIQTSKPQELPLGPEVLKGTRLDERTSGIINRADTLLLSSRSKVLGDDPRQGVDINHRGGKPGFVEIIDPNLLSFPDYVGNYFFNTLGNIMLDSRVGVQFIDFNEGTLLNIKGHAELIMDESDNAKPPYTGRTVQIRIDEITTTLNAFPRNPQSPEYSIMLPDD